MRLDYLTQMPGLQVSYRVDTGDFGTYVYLPDNATQQDIDDVNTAVDNYPAYVAALEAQATANTANKSAAAAMIATFAVSEEAINYFNALQEAIRDVSDNNSIDIAAVFPAMKALLDDVPTLYQRYLNLLRISTGISQATFEGSPTAAQQRNAFIVALEFANTGMIQMALGALFS